MRRVLFFLTFFTFLNKASAQQLFNDVLRFMPDSVFNKEKSLVAFQGDYSFNSNSITNNFFRKFINNAYIDNSLKDEVSGRLHNKNRYGFDINASLFSHIKKEKYSILAGVSSRQMNSTVFSKDMFELFFRGNKPFAGKNAYIAPLKFQFFNYQSFSLGLKKSTENNKLTAWFGLSGIRGGNLRHIDVQTGTLYTEADGAYLRATTDFSASFSSGKPSFIGESNGAGASAFFGADLKLKKSVLGFSVSDLGFIRWNNLKTFSSNPQNPVYVFNGKEIPNILSFSDTLFKSYNADSLAKEVGIDIKHKSKTYMIPAVLKLNYMYYCSDKVYLLSGLQYITNAGYLPKLSLKAFYSFSKKFIAHAEVSGGGYGKVDFELGLTALQTEKFAVYLNIFAAEFYTAPSKTSGNGVALSLIKNL